MQNKMATVLHITHRKAGSQWIHKIMNALASAIGQISSIDRPYIEPLSNVQHFLSKPIKNGYFYPTLYVTYDQYQKIQIPSDSAILIVIRDLRDTQVSGYFSIRYSHIPNSKVLINREKISNQSEEEGLLTLMDLYLPINARIQSSWAATEFNLIRYEDLLTNDIEILLPFFSKQCRVPLDELCIENTIKVFRFENLTKGRHRGDEEIYSHERKGIENDWKNHFTPKVKDAFKEKYGDILIQTGYEKNYDW